MKNEERLERLEKIEALVANIKTNSELKGDEFNEVDKYYDKLIHLDYLDILKTLKELKEQL